MNQRKIKFRFWDKGSERFIVDQNAPNGINELLEKSEKFGVIPLQFTGLLDKQGKEIYEGDIVRSRVDAGADIYENWQDLDEEVYFGGGAFYPVSMADTTKEYEVIGNIYESEL